MEEIAKQNEQPTCTAATLKENILTDKNSSVEVACEKEQNSTKKDTSKDKTLTPKQKKQRLIKNTILLHMGIILMSTSVYFFQTPNRFTLGGIAGVAILLSSSIQSEIFTQAVYMIIINILLIFVGLAFLGKQCTLLTIYSSVLYTCIIAVFEKTIPLNGPLTDDKFLEICYAVLTFGVGGALIFNCGASSGGTDIIALILKKFIKLNVGVSLMIIDLLVICISIYTFKAIDIVFYSFLGLFARTFLLDGVIESFGKTKCLTIVTSSPDEIGKFILEVIDHSYTRYEAEGGYTHEKKCVIMTVCRRAEALRVKMKVKELDPASFIIITDAKEIVGKGFGDTAL